MRHCQRRYVCRGRRRRGRGLAEAGPRELFSSSQHGAHVHGVRGTAPAACASVLYCSRFSCSCSWQSQQISTPASSIISHHTKSLIGVRRPPQRSAAGHRLGGALLARHPGADHANVAPQLQDLLRARAEQQADCKGRGGKRPGRQRLRPRHAAAVAVFTPSLPTLTCADTAGGGAQGSQQCSCSVSDVRRQQACTAS